MAKDISKRFLLLLGLELRAVFVYPNKVSSFLNLIQLPLRVLNILNNKGVTKWFGKEFFYETRFEPILMHVHLNEVFHLSEHLDLNDFDHVLDIGANVGQFAFALRNADFKGTICSFEPNPFPRQQLANNAALDPHWQIFPFGISNKCEKSDFYFVKNRSGQGSLAHENSVKEMIAVSGSTQIKTTVELIDGQRILELCGPRHWRLIKVDVEGHESVVCEQLRHLDMDFVLIEINEDRNGYGVDQIIEILCDKGRREVHAVSKNASRHNSPRDVLFAINNN
jgi:FkbM family methyltransferase